MKIPQLVIQIGVISLASKSTGFFEQKIPPELTDAFIFAKKENIPILTEDYLYGVANALETNEKAPEYFSTFALFKVLYETGEISFNEYLDYFGYLSSYRCKFLSFSSDDVVKAIFGDKEVKIVKIDNIQKFNFKLTLSEEYGVSFKSAFSVVGKVLYKAVTDNSILPEVTERLYFEIIEAFPTDNKKELSLFLFHTCSELFAQQLSPTLVSTPNSMAQIKLDKLSQACEVYYPSPRLF